jgi:hypothetical protein
MTPETAKKVGDALRGKAKSAEHCAKLSVAKIGNTASLGRVVSADTRRKIGDAHKGKIVSPETIDKIKIARAKQAPIRWSEQSKRNYSALVKSLGRVPPSRLGFRKTQGEVQ